MYNNLKTLGASLFLIGALSACGNSDSSSANSDTAMAYATPVDTTRTTAPPSPEQGEDSKLVADLVESLRGDMALAKDGEAKAQSKQVKDLAKKLETTSTTLVNQMSGLAQTKNWSTPMAESSADVAMRTDLAKKASTEYQKDWLSTIKGRLQTNITRLQNGNPTDADLKAEGDKALPVLKDLLADVEKTEGMTK